MDRLTAKDKVRIVLGMLSIDTLKETTDKILYESESSDKTGDDGELAEHVLTLLMCLAEKITMTGNELDVVLRDLISRDEQQ